MLYQKPPTDAELAAVGLTRADYEDDELEEVPFFPDMFESWEMFLAMATQWKYAPNGKPVGIDYNSFHTVAKIYKIDDEETAFNDLRIMEQHAIAIISNQK